MWLDISSNWPPNKHKYYTFPWHAWKIFISKTNQKYFTHFHIKKFINILFINPFEYQNYVEEHKFYLNYACIFIHFAQWHNEHLFVLLNCRSSIYSIVSQLYIVSLWRLFVIETSYGMGEMVIKMTLQDSLLVQHWIWIFEYINGAFFPICKLCMFIGHHSLIWFFN